MLKKEILRRKSDFQKIYRKGKSVADRYVVLFYLSNGLAYNRTAFLASRKVGNAVQRNRAKRLMRESWKEFERDVPPGYDIIIIARNTINNRSCGEVKASVEKGLRRLKLLSRTGEK